ncbi:hypothetical protein EDF52_1197 [Curtobacterium sp. PhB42]|uniref:hypothetical protein n=1 Tax=unclassified Curtobacterium TaxID=257496 RepID=UPI001063BE23|nr:MULTISPECIES: hypothetical protein [unclassified Curtobacterium]TDW39746.1 hypothetical protein EDF52_1197 [Curtobacterium sp. PhB42]TDW50909.1 hypothetical protein EDF47_11464 [Curtobacterium sp. PhB190]
MLSVVPVLALAMIVEVSRQLRHAEQLSWRTRALQSVLLGGYAAALLVAFRMSLDGLVHRDGMERAEIVGALVFSSLLVLVALPLFDVLMRVNPEAQEVLRRAMPWSRWRKDRRYLKRKVVPEVRRTQQDVRADLARAERLLADLDRAKIEAAETRMVWLAARQLNEHIPASVSEAAGWAELQKHARDGEVDLLAPGTALGRLERDAHSMKADADDLRMLGRRVDSLVRRVDIRVRGARILRFNRHDKTDFLAQIRSVQEDLSQHRPA